MQNPAQQMSQFPETFSQGKTDKVHQLDTHKLSDVNSSIHLIYHIYIRLQSCQPLHDMQHLTRVSRAYRGAQINPAYFRQSSIFSSIEFQITSRRAAVHGYMLVYMKVSCFSFECDIETVFAKLEKNKGRA